MSVLKKYDATTGQWIPIVSGAPGPQGPAGESANPAGTDTQVQFNDGGTNFGADAGLTYSKTAKRLETEAYGLKAGGIVTDSTTARTLSASDNGKVIYFTNASAITVTTAANLGAGFSCLLVQAAAGQITVVAGTNCTLLAYLSQVKSAGAGACVSVLCAIDSTTDTFLIAGQTA